MDIIWVGTAFLFGLAANQLRLPPLVGYLIAGFVLHALGVRLTETLEHFADIGITLLLFTIGLKLRLETLLRPAVWAVASLHMTIIMLVFTLVLSGLAGLQLALFSGLEWKQLWLIAFALSFSSTVFAVKVFEDKGVMGSLYGRIAIGILIMQDLAAVLFLALSTGKLPSVWAVLLLALIPMRYTLMRIMDRIGHGELLLLYGLAIALGGAALFEIVNIKGDLGALILGILLGAHPRAKEMARELMGLKDLFLVGFFLSVGMLTSPQPVMLVTAVLLALLVPFKFLLFFRLLTWFRISARTSMVTGLSLANYSEFGLIVAAVGYEYGWLTAEWLGALAIMISLLFILGAPLNANIDPIYLRFRDRLRRYQKADLDIEEQPIDPGEADVVIFGMGRVGTGAYDAMTRELGKGRVLGFDFDQAVVNRHIEAGRNVIRASAIDPEFWSRVDITRRGRVNLIMLAMPSFYENRYAAEQIRKLGIPVRISATAKYRDESEKLRSAGVDAVFNLYDEAGVGFATSTLASWESSGS